MLKFSNDAKQVEISPSIVVFSVAFLLFLYFLFLIRSVLVLFFLGFILMVALNPLVKLLERRLKLPRLLGIAITYILVLVLIVLTLSLLLPPLVAQLYQFIKTLQLPWLQERLSNLTFSLSEASTLVDQIGSSASTLYSVVASTFGTVFTVFTVLVMSFYLMLERNRLHLRVAWFTKKKSDIDQAKEFLDSLEVQLGGWVQGQLILMLVIGLVTYIGLTLIAIPYALPLALLAASLEILPNLGPTIAAIPAIVVAYVTLNPAMGLVTLLFYILVQQFENNLLVPKIMKDNVDVSPLISIISILIGLKLAGVIGALLAIPTYIIIRTIYSTWFKDRIIGE